MLFLESSCRSRSMQTYRIQTYRQYRRNFKQTFHFRRAKQPRLSKLCLTAANLYCQTFPPLEITKVVFWFYAQLKQPCGLNYLVSVWIAKGAVLSSPCLKQDSCISLHVNWKKLIRKKTVTIGKWIHLGNGSLHPFGKLMQRNTPWKILMY